IDIALSEDPHLEVSDIVGKGYTDEERPDELSNLVYFRGRYYSYAVFAQLFGISEATPQFVRAKDTTPIPDYFGEEEQEVRNILRRHFLGKYVFEVFDHVWIWLTSPTKTIFSVPVEDDQTVYAIESPDRGPIAELQRVKVAIDSGQYSGNDLKTLKDRQAQLIKELKGISVTEVQQNTIGSAVEFQRYQKSLENNYPIDGQFPGLQEQQYQAFEGIITSVNESYSDGKYQLQLSCKDVMHYLTLSRIMIKPSLRGTSVDAPKGFLNNPIWRERDLKPANLNPSQSFSDSRVGQWKSGMFVTYDEFLFGNVGNNQQQSGLFEGGGAQYKTPVDEGLANHGVFLSTQPFAGIDAANVISFLVTGIPYNFDTFFRSGLEFGRLFVANNPGGAQIPGVTDGYFAMLRRQIAGIDNKGQNAHLGDFKPYTSIAGDSKELTALIADEFQQYTTKLDVLKVELQKLVDAGILSLTDRDNLIEFAGYGQALYLTENPINLFTSSEPPEQNKIPIRLKPMIREIDRLQLNLLGHRQLEAQQAEDVERLVQQQGSIGESSDSILTKALTDNPLEARKGAIVSNTDENLLVIDSAYSGNLDIQAFNRELASSQSAFSLWQSEYDTPLATCQKAAESIDFEFYANSQGHLLFKPPTYNRTLKEHLADFDTVDKIVKPLLAARFSGADGRKFEDQLRKSTILERALDDFSSQLQRMRANNPNNFDRLAHPDATKNIAYVYSRLGALSGEDLAEGIDTSIDTDGVTAGDLDIIISDTKQHIAIAGDNEDSTEAKFEIQVKSVIGNALKVEALANVVGPAVRKARKDLDTFFDDPSTAIIVDENRIHVITDGSIISSSFAEQPPKFTRLDVQGQPDLVNLAEAGETYYWAGGVDFDLWRDYGFLQESRTKPQFHSGPACAPYCHALLGRQWGKIFSGSLTLRGDSKYRLGDCVFIESRDMYYYIEGVQNSFTYGSSYTTTLTLGFGRRRGWYIPHPFDVLGDLTSRAYFDLYEDHKQRNLEGQLLAISEEEAETQVVASGNNSVVPGEGGVATAPVAEDMV
ncbi:MAG: hypothetical protein DRP01_09745, partial [Archaeoglobales archaeon]